VAIGAHAGRHNQRNNTNVIGAFDENHFNSTWNPCRNTVLILVILDQFYQVVVLKLYTSTFEIAYLNI
jgi:hypothetical protein